MHPWPALEAERVLALQATHILDSQPAPDFDAAVALVRDLFSVPISLVSLLDTDRQWFKAKCGISVDGTERSLAFCNYTVVSDEIFVVEDAALDTRFCDNPLVTGAPHIRFYAGAPLLVSPGVALGSLCAIGTEPRKVTASEIVALQRLAKIVTGLIRGHGTADAAAQLARDAEAQRQIIYEQARDLRLRERRFLQTERMAKIGGWEVDLATNAVAWSDETYRICGVALGTPVDFEFASSVYPPMERERLDAAIRRTLLNGTGFDEEFEFETDLRKWVRVVGEVELLDGAQRRLFGTIQDVSERHHADAQLWKAANRDSLTGLYNRNRFDELLGAAFFGPAPAPGMLLVDANRLKEVNDTLGHEAGDALIRAVAQRVTEAVGSVGTVARVGGDEFAVLLADPGGDAGLEALATTILEAMRPSFVFKGNTLKPSVSIGAAVGCLRDGPEVLRQSADLALYHAKAHRLGGFALFHEGLKSAITARIAAVSRVDDALTSGEIFAWYQPVVELATGQVSGLEALARIRCDGAFRSIGEFAEALHDRRTATRLTACMFERIETDIKAWKTAGITLPRIGFNVGSFDFQEGAIEEMLLSLCERADVNPSRFVMEVTESVFLSRDANIVAETASRLRARGVIVALDDFGTGHASLAHLGTFPVDVIKMDRSFVMRMDDDGNGAVIAAALIDLAHKLDIQIIAEGVEHEAQLDRLRTLGCEKVQGYLFSPAMPPTAVGAFLAAFQPRISSKNGQVNARA